MKKTTLFSLVIVLLLLLSLIYAPLSHLRQRLSVARLFVESYYTLPLHTGDTLYLASSPTLSRMVSISADSVMYRTDQTAVWVSPQGHLLASVQADGDAAQTLGGEELKQFLASADSVLARQKKSLQLEVEELDYYAARHSVVDDGYNEVMEYRTHIQTLLMHTDSTLQKVHQVKDLDRLQAYLCHHMLVSSAGNRTVSEVQQKGRYGQFLLLQTVNAILPQGADFMPIALGSLVSKQRHIVAFNDWGGESRADTACVLTDTIPWLSTVEGGAWVNGNGSYCGMVSRGEPINLTTFSPFMGYSTPLAWWWAWTRVPRWSSDIPLHVTAPMPPCELLIISDSVRYIGQTARDEHTGKVIRQGRGQLEISNGVHYMGHWAADTLVYGVRNDIHGTYKGMFNAQLQAEGMGTYRAVDGQYYYGEWLSNKRHGWGFASHSGKMILSGVWRKNRFRGERMVYTQDRVYGIDISRYQHEVKGRVHPIDWNRLRITYLAKDRPVQGEVDYPVSYVYIKSTQGDNIINRYYQNDSRQARKRGIPVGSYHFFSTKVSGARQAEYFLKHTNIQPDDLPPMLDVEPSNHRVAKMGGDKELVRQMKIWLNIVEKATGKRPLIYSYQKFIDEHLAEADDLLQDYPVWVARYGEYKPYYRLLHWQLSPTGRVTGIEGEVDINVYNGTKEQFRYYLETVREPMTK